MGEERIVSNKVVLMALKSIAGRINPSDGILASHYKKVVKDTFEILKDNGERYNTLEIKGWFIRKARFAPKLVNDIVDVAQKIQEGKTIRTIDKLPSWREDIIDTWRKESEDPTINSEDWKGRF